MGPFRMDQIPGFSQSFTGFNCHNVDANACHSIEDQMSDMKHFLMDDNVAVDSFLGFGMENMDISSKMDEFSHAFDFGFLPDHHSCCTQAGEAGLKPEILDGFLDEVNEVEDFYRSHNLSSIGDHYLPETEVKKKESELDGDPCRFLNLSSESCSPGISGSIGLSEWSKETVVHAESQNVSNENVKDSLNTTSNNMHCLYGSEDDKNPLSSFIGSWVGQGKARRKNVRKTSCTRLDSFVGEYDIRPRKGPVKKYIHSPIEIDSSDDQLTSSESEDDIYVANTSKSRRDRRKRQRIWTVDEVVKLVDGISHFGVGKWTDIKNLFFHSASHRTPIDIRDKWRNLLKSTNKYTDGEVDEKRRSAARPIPKDILHRVRELASLHPYSLSKSPSFVHDSPRSRSTSKKTKKRS